MTVRLDAYSYQNSGTASAGLTVEVYARGNPVPIDSTTTDADGYWEFTALATGVVYDVKITDGSTVRWLKGDVAAQFETIVGADGVSAPLPNNSVTNAMLDSTNFPGYSITADTGTVPTNNTNSFKVWFGRLLTLVKAITGKANWFDLPDYDLTDIGTHTHDGSNSAIVALPYTEVALSADTLFSNAAWTDLCSLSLAAGTYLLLAPVQVINTANNTSDYEAVIWDGSTIYGSASGFLANGANSVYGYASVLGKATLVGTTTVKLSVREHTQTTGIPQAEHTDAVNATAGVATRLMALRIA